MTKHEEVLDEMVRNGIRIKSAKVRIPQTHAHTFENHPVLKQLPLRLVSVGPGHTELHAYDKGLDMIVAHQIKNGNHHVLIHSNLQNGKEVKGVGEHKDVNTAINLAIANHKKDFSHNSRLKEENLEEAAKSDKVIFIPGHGTFHAFRRKEDRDAMHDQRRKSGDELVRKVRNTHPKAAYPYMLTLA